MDNKELENEIAKIKERYKNIELTYYNKNGEKEYILYYN